MHRHLPAEWRREEAAAAIDSWIAADRVRQAILDASQRDCRLCGGETEIPDDIGLVTPQMLSDELAALVTQVKVMRERRVAAYRKVGHRVAGFLEQIADDADVEDELLKTVRAAIAQAKQDRIGHYIAHVAQDLVTQLNQLHRADLIPPDTLDAFETINLQSGK